VLSPPGGKYLIAFAEGMKNVEAKRRQTIIMAFISRVIT
jgi:hypothetical protein